MKINHLLIALGIFLITACSPSENSLSNESNNQSITGNANLAYAQAKADRLANVENDVESLLSKLTLEEKIGLVHASGKFHVDGIERLAIPELWLSDGPHGVRHQIEKYTWNSANWDNDHSTYLPHLTSVAASWDVNMATMHGNVLGSEARERGKDIILGPGVNLARLPLYGRNFEYMGEDPILAAKLVVPEVIAIQKNDVAANAKHYALNTQELNRIGVNAKPDERTLREVYLAVFEAAVKQGGVYSLMGSYNQYYGTNANQSKHLVMDILKGEWGFDGVLLTDWNVDINTYDAALNGLDLEMGTNVESWDDYFLAKPLLKEIKAGKIPVAVLDDKVRRVLRLMLKVGLMDENRLPGSRNTKEHQLAARVIAANGVVLLKNQNDVLPLNKSKLKNVLVIGPNADKKHGTGGGSSEVKSLYEITPLQGLKNELGDNVNITVMRARSSVLTPIAADYVASRHWTGTPAWNISYYKDAEHQALISDSWIVNSEYRSTSGQSTDFITMKADIKPLKSGAHTLNLSLVGDFELSIDGNVVMTHQGDSANIISHAVDLTALQTYKFEINYTGNQHFTLGWDAPGNLFSTEDEYLNAAKSADAVIYFGGLSHGDDREAIDRPDMKLPNSQDEIISKLLVANDNTVIFMVAGSAVEMPWAEQANTIVWGWYGGMEAGNAFADVLVGDVNPSGKMPITLPEKLEHTAPIMLNDYNEIESLYSEGVFIGYRWFEKQNIKPTFEFGHGLSYTQFSYDNIELSTKSYDGEKDLIVTATITNTGKVAGAEVVQLYLNDIEASVERPIKELKGFTKVYLEPGESRAISITLNKRDLSFWDVNQDNWLAEKGEFKVLLGASLSDIRLTEVFQYNSKLH
ncbi:glycoside hydrolase family 3 C-terminal domain-containing protein [Colwelliaceae bacterium BS250]